MALEFQLDSLDGVAADIASEYKEVDGKFVLDINGVKPVDEFSKVHNLLQTERNTRKTLEAQLKQFGDRKAEDFYTLEDQIEQLKLTQGDVDENKLKEMVELKTRPVSRAAERAAAERDDAMQRLSDLKLKMVKTERENRLVAAAGDKIKPEFLKDLKLRATADLDYDEATDSFLDQAGMNIEEYVAQQIKQTPGWLPDSNGGGSRTKLGGDRKMSDNPFETGNLTMQARLYKENKALYTRMKQDHEASKGPKSNTINQ